ncbi:MAG: RNA-guided endonuclease TnpB family protein [Chloroflexi bacterium]|nr:RNA-guided endonuclease TnpB family protein [Chloroflexota bacterium]
MELTRTYKFKLYRADQNGHLIQQIDIAGIIYNHCIALHRRYYRLFSKGLNKYALMKHLTKLKKLPRHAFWSKVGSQAIQDVVARIDKGYALFFRNLKAKIRTSPPGFKRVKKYASFTLKQAGWKLLGDNRIRIQGRNYKFVKSREIPPAVRTLTVKRDKLGNLWLYFVCQETIQSQATMTGNRAGFDFGMKVFLTDDQGGETLSPLYLKQAQQALCKANRSLSRKRRGSGGWYKAQDRLNKVYLSVVNKRTDWFFKLAHNLTDRFDFLFFEDLSMKGMQALWGRKISDLARSEFMNVLGYVASLKNKTVHLVDRFFPSSKTCSCCGYIHKELTLKDRQWHCVSCGVDHHRDINAAVNILREGSSSLGETAVRLQNERCSLEAAIAISPRIPCL